MSDSVKITKRFGAGFILSCFFILSNTCAQIFPKRADWGPTTWALGGGAAASAANQDAILTNPAGLVYFEHKSSMGGAFLQLPLEERHWRVALVDGTQGLIGAFQFDWNDQAMSIRKTYTLSTAYQTPYGAYGVSFQTVQFDKVIEGEGWHYTGSAGALVPVGLGFSLGVYGKSFLDLEKDHHFPPSLHVGLLYTYPETIRISVEANKAFRVSGQNWNYSFGADCLVYQYFTLRGGYHSDHSNEYSFGSAGVGILGSKTEIAATYIRPLSTPSDHGFGVDLTLKF